MRTATLVSSARADRPAPGPRIVRWILCAAVGLPGILPAQESAPTENPFVADLAVLVRELPLRHKNAFHAVTKEAWLSEADRLKERLPTTEPDVAVVELKRLVAMIADSHTILYADRESKAPLVYRMSAAVVPVAEGFVFWALPVEHREHLGRPILSVAGVPWAEAAARLGRSFAAENDSWRKEQLAEVLLDRATRRLCGLTDADGATEFTVAGEGGKPASFTLRQPKNNVEARAVKFARRPEFAALAPSLALQRPIYGHRLMPESGALYVWYDACRSDRERPLDVFVAEALADLDRGLAATPPTITRVVVDLRRNGGGNSVLLTPFIAELAKRKAVNTAESLRVLIGRRTFSSAVMNALAFRKATAAKLYGEPTGGALNHYGEVKALRLPATGLQLQYSTKYHRQVEGLGLALDPDVVVMPTAAQFASGQDVVLEAALR